MKIRLTPKNDALKIFSFLGALFCALILVVGLSAPVRAQNVKGSVRGAVTDEQGRALLARRSKSLSRRRGTRVTSPPAPMANTISRTSRSAMFTIRATHPGFKTTEETGIRVNAADRLVFNVRLKDRSGQRTGYR